MILTLNHLTSHPSPFYAIIRLCPTGMPEFIFSVSRCNLFAGSV